MPTPERLGHYRWRICALLFIATTINYLDRTVFGYLGPTLQYQVFHWSDNSFAYVNMAFKAAYAVGLLTMGAVIDKIGTRRGFAIAIVVWSIFGLLQAAVPAAWGAFYTMIAFCVLRFGLGFGEGGNFPAANKTVAEWFPQKERAFASGLYVSGSSLGPLLAPIILPLVVSPNGVHWQWGFLTTGVFSALWLALWWHMYRPPAQHPRVSPGELALIQAGSFVETTGVKVRWRSLLPLRETWAWAVLKIPDAAWWFYLFWGAKFFYDQFGLDIQHLALPFIVIYVTADIGGILGGWMSSRFLRRWPVNRARKTALLCCALCVVPVIFVTQLDTRFIVNDDFFHRLDHAQIPGDTAGATVAVPAADAAALRALLNQNYTSAKQFSRGAATALGAVKTGPYLPAILRAAGRNPSAEALADQLQTALPPDLLTMLRSLRNRKFVTPMDIPPALNELAGRAEEARIEPALLTCARTDNWYWLAVFLLALAAGGHQAWAASVFAISSDIFPQKAIASVTGFGGMVGALGSLIADFVLGNLLTNSGPAGYFFAFLFASCIYLVCLGGMHLLMPRMTPLGEDLRPAPR